MHGGIATVVETGVYAESLPSADGQHVLDAHLGALPIIEISDKDYRSFCWPCHALEEAGDGKSGT